MRKGRVRGIERRLLPRQKHFAVSRRDDPEGTCRLMAAPDTVVMRDDVPGELVPWGRPAGHLCGEGPEGLAAFAAMMTGFSLDGHGGGATNVARVYEVRQKLEA